MDVRGSDPRRDAWSRVVGAIEDLLPCYERINTAATFFLLPLWREAVAAHSAGMGAVLEIGPGSGGFSRMLHGRVTCLDASPAILAYARERTDGGRYRFAEGLAERLPFKDEAFDGVFSSFAFRDFLDQRASLEEMRRVLRPGGEAHILDISPPPEGWLRTLLGTWIAKGVPHLASLLAPSSIRSSWETNPYWSFTETYLAMESPDEYADAMREAGFGPVRWRYLGARAVFHLRGVRPRTT
jgi:ubiquinone/menaquinone biosynthesis C-methylase UbiE